jgi:hypothetical protein
MKKSNGLVMKFINQIKILIFVSISWYSCDKNYSGTNAVNNVSNNVSYAGAFMKSDPNDSTSAGGNVTATFNTVSHLIDYKINWNGLTTTPVAMHFHDNGPIIVKINNFPVGLSGSVSGSASFTAAQATDLVSGYIYIMIHTQKYPNGEIMATLVKQ